MLELGPWEPSKTGEVVFISSVADLNRTVLIVSKAYKLFKPMILQQDKNCIKNRYIPKTY